MTVPYDLAEPDNEAPAPQPTEAAPTKAASRVSGGNGPLLDEQDEKKIVDAIVQMVRDDMPNRKRRRTEWECYKRWLRGDRGVRVRRTSEDYNAVELLVPLGSGDLPPVMDRADELLEKFVAHLIADPAIPDAEPATDSDQDRDAAEFTTRLLTVEGSESGYNNQAVTRRAQRKAGVYGSGFVYVCIDPQGGGWRPMEIRALPTAQTVQDAAMDPATGQHLGADDERLTTRYVMPGGQLTDDPAQAKRQWMPKLVPEVVTGEQVVLLPQTCTGIADACGFIIIRFSALDKLKARFAKRLGNLSDEDAHKLVNWTPEDAKQSLPGHLAKTHGKDVKSSALCCTLSLYYTSHGQYPKGAYVVVGGGDMVLHKQTWSGMVETGPQKLQEECLQLPLAQFRQFDDDVNDDPFGTGLIRKIGPADEVRGDIILAWQDYLDRVNHPIPFLPLGSIVQPDQLAIRDDTPVYFNPQGKPEYEKVEPFPPDAKEFFDRATASQDSATGLEETAQGVDTASASSGVAKQIVVQQAHVNTSQARQNHADGQERLWRIIAQHCRVFYTVPMRMKYQGDDGAYKEQEWTRSDLGSTKDIRIARNSFTQQSPEQKQANLDARLQMGGIDQDEYDRLSSSNLRATIGIQDNPHRMRVRRQLRKWREGPAKEWAPPNPPMDPATGQPAIDPMTGQPIPPQPDPANPFADVREVDYEQDVAIIRHREIRRELSGSKIAKVDPTWRSYLVNEYQMMRQAAGVATLQEQQMAAQQQAQAQADADAQKTNAKAGETRDKIDAQAAESAAEREFRAQQADADRERDLTAEAMRAQGAPTPA